MSTVQEWMDKIDRGVRKRIAIYFYAKKMTAAAFEGNLKWQAAV